MWNLNESDCKGVQEAQVDTSEVQGVQQGKQRAYNRGTMEVKRDTKGHKACKEGKGISRGHNGQATPKSQQVEFFHSIIFINCVFL